MEVESAWYDRCPVGTLCLFDQPDGEGHMTVVRSDIPDIGATRIDGNPVSLWNRTGRTVDFYDHTGYSGNVDVFHDNEKRSGSPVHRTTRSIKIL
ncbi:peptidase inhibitor family I36 protein [Nocardia concava]|uniref:peptidase inhibitor family I36 protein n=1 Tax=Nocardia concava TaxID=257281 RepID=UPI0002F92511|nr:peptidase inhibitor family I36 protein [Nocardia concava]